MLGTVHGGSLGIFEMDHIWAIWTDVWLEIGNRPRLGNMKGRLVDFFEWTLAEKYGQSFGQKFWTDPRLG